MTQYGSDSAIFRVYNQVNSVVLGNIYTNGIDNALTGIQPVVRQDCVGAQQQWPKRRSGNDDLGRGDDANWRDGNSFTLAAI
jgi:hypothetical protein